MKSARTTIIPASRPATNSSATSDRWRTSRTAKYRESRKAASRLAAAQLRVADVAVKLVADVKMAVYELHADAALLAHRRTVADIHSAALELELIPQR